MAAEMHACKLVAYSVELHCKPAQSAKAVSSCLCAKRVRYGQKHMDRHVCQPVIASSDHPRMYAKFCLFIGKLPFTSSGKSRKLHHKCHAY